MSKIALTKGKFALVDDEDFDWLNQWKWSLNGNGYAVRTAKVSRGLFTVQRMHRVIMNAPDGLHVDHINGDKLDNRRLNLRLCTSQQNSFNRGVQSNNTSGYKGVYLHKKRNLMKRWYAKVFVDGKYHCKGMFATPLEAAKAYNVLAVEYHGEFARLNKV